MSNDDRNYQQGDRCLTHNQQLRLLVEGDRISWAERCRKVESQEQGIYKPWSLILLTGMLQNLSFSGSGYVR